MKKVWMAMLMGAFLLGLALPAMAEHGARHECAAGEECPMKKGGCDEGGKEGCDSDESMCPILSKTLKKAGWMLEHAEELGLSDEQIAKVRQIQTDAKKDAIRMEAEMKIGQMEMEAKLSEDTVDVAALNAMMEQGMVGWTSQAKAAIQRYAELKGVATAEQKAKAKALRHGKKDGHKEHKK
jgi:hypothetical protein